MEPITAWRKYTYGLLSAAHPEHLIIHFGKGSLLQRRIVPFHSICHSDRHDEPKNDPANHRVRHKMRSFQTIVAQRHCQVEGQELTLLSALLCGGNPQARGALHLSCVPLCRALFALQPAAAPMGESGRCAKSVSNRKACVRSEHRLSILFSSLPESRLPEASSDINASKLMEPAAACLGLLLNRCHPLGPHSPAAADAKPEGLRGGEAVV